MIDSVPGSVDHAGFRGPYRPLPGRCPNPDKDPLNLSTLFRRSSLLRRVALCVFLDAFSCAGIPNVMGTRDPMYLAGSLL